MGPIQKESTSIMKKWILWFNLLLLPLTSTLRADVLEEELPVVILGGGVGALTSAIYLARAGIPPVVITGPFVGGTITQSHNVQNWPGESSISGLDLGDKVKSQAELNGAVLNAESVISVDFSKRPFLITTKEAFGSEKKYKAQSVIIALGATPNLLNVPGETGPNGYWSRGVYSCAVCDGSLYKDKVVAIVGGGDGALIEAQYLSNIASKVHILVRGDSFRAIEKERLKEVLSRTNVEVHYKTNIKEIKGDGQKATHLVVQDSFSRRLKDLPVDALFLAIGSFPNTQFFQGQLELDAQGYIVLKKHQQTSIEGIYAVGDVSDPEFKQAVSAAGDAAKAAMQAQKFLAASGTALKAVPVIANEKKSELKKVIEIKSVDQFASEVKDAKGPIFIDFYSTHCGPCRTFSPLYETWAKEHGGRTKFLKVNADHARELFEQYQIRAVPTLVILDEKGNIVRKSIGSREISEIDKRLEKIKRELTSQDFK